MLMLEEALIREDKEVDGNLKRFWRVFIIAAHGLREKLNYLKWNNLNFKQWKEMCMYDSQKRRKGMAEGLVSTEMIRE